MNGEYLKKFKELPELVKQFGGLIILTIIVISSFAILNIFLVKVKNW